MMVPRQPVLEALAWLGWLVWWTDRPVGDTWLFINLLAHAIIPRIMVTMGLYVVLWLQ